MDVKETIYDSWTLDELLRALSFQIEAYKIFKAQGHQTLMEMNLEAIKNECVSINSILVCMEVVDERWQKHEMWNAPSRNAGKDGG